MCGSSSGVGSHGLAYWGMLVWCSYSL
ncbi:protein of unknown function (plasmid) [Azospirillum baldaniorum]|uniref:Uncharacterized protein n=1 Tax=Azospirillum baldaniorum TaxID=1064539 RepID=A0A9P1JTV0_9PROT|nr:protein of unknown function [Azospirillum baldaniorum]